jgi:hypothetical protein
LSAAHLANYVNKEILYPVGEEVQTGPNYWLWRRKWLSPVKIQVIGYIWGLLHVSWRFWDNQRPTNKPQRNTLFVAEHPSISVANRTGIPAQQSCQRSCLEGKALTVSANTSAECYKNVGSNAL